MKDIRNPLASAIHYALGAGVVAGLAVTAAPAFAQDEEAADLDRVQVTGSRISRTDIEGALPVTVIDREQIEFSGQTSVADLLRDTPFNSAGSFRPQSGSTGQASSQVNLRGLGSQRTLILIDGKRAPVAPNLGQGQDLRNIPLAAVERIEILSDGASAIYGSDAIGGVVNIVTRKDFTGVELNWGTSDPKREGGDRNEASALFGISGDRGQIMLGVSYDERDIIFARDVPWNVPGASVFSNNFIGLGGGRPFIAANEAGCAGEGFFIGPGGACGYDFTLQSADEAATRNESLFTRTRFDINADWSIFMNAQVGRVTSFGRYAPVPSSPWPVTASGFIELPPGTPNHPATPPSAGGLNPLWEQYQDVADQTVQFTHRFAASGNRDTTTDSQLYDVDLGAQGRIGNFDVEFGLRRTESQYTEVGRGYVVALLAQNQFDTGGYNIYDPFGNSPESLSSFTATIGRDANYLAKEFYANASTDLFELPAGTVGVAFGAEYREEDYKDIFDDLSANGNITGSAGNSSSGGRDSTSVYGEILVPVFENLEVTGALRYDDFSDFGDALSPKLAVRYQPLDQLTLRASWGEGFRAPTLDILGQRPTFGAASIVDDISCPFLDADFQPGEACQINSWSIANPNIDAEESEQINLGVAFEPFDWLSGSVDWWKLEITNEIAGIGAGFVIGCIRGTIEACPPGITTFAPGTEIPNPELGLGARFRPGSDAFDVVQTGFTNQGTIDTEGFDVNLRGNWNFGEMGSLRVNAQGTYVASLEFDGGNNVAGNVNRPRWRASLNSEYRISDFAFAWVMNYIDDQNNSLADAGPLPSWTTHDLQANWFTPWNGQITVGVDNVANKDPVLDAGELRSFNFGLYDGYGRIPYVRYKQNF
jgi:iron complex outermembrane receptor protein